MLELTKVPSRRLFCRAWFARLASAPCPQHPGLLSPAGAVHRDAYQGPTLRFCPECTPALSGSAGTLSIAWGLQPRDDHTERCGGG